MVDVDSSMREVFARTGFWHLRGFLGRDQQDAFTARARELAAICPFKHPRMRDGREMSVRVSSFGERGWWADEQGYRYVDRHPKLDRAWPPIPESVLTATASALHAAANQSVQANPRWWIDQWGIGAINPIPDHVAKLDTCLVNLYEPGAQLGWHVDQTERDRKSPIVTFSIGATCIFWLRMEDAGETRTFRCELRSGDAVIMAGPARLAEHQVTHVRDDDQSDLFGGNYNPISASAPGVRLSFTIRRTGWG